MFSAAGLIKSAHNSLRLNRTAQADHTLRVALNDATRIGATRIANEASAGLRALGRKPRRAAIYGAGALTRTELEIAKLASLGHSNKRIAANRHVSVRTVENHLRHIYQKLQTDRDGLRGTLADHT